MGDIPALAERETTLGLLAGALDPLEVQVLGGSAAAERRAHDEEEARPAGGWGDLFKNLHEPAAYQDRIRHGEHRREPSKHRSQSQDQHRASSRPKKSEAPSADLFARPGREHMGGAGGVRKQSPPSEKAIGLAKHLGSDPTLPDARRQGRARLDHEWFDRWGGRGGQCRGYQQQRRHNWSLASSSARTVRISP